MKAHFDDKGSMLAALQTLTSSVYPGAEVSDSRYLEWLYLRNPDGEAVVHTDEDDQGLSAQFVLTPRRYLVRGEIVKGALSLNTITREDARGKGLFRKLGDLAFENLPSESIGFITGFPNRASRKVFTGVLGYGLLGKVPFLAKPLRWHRLPAVLLHRRRMRKGEDLSFTVPFSSVFRSKKWAVSAEPFAAPVVDELLSEINGARLCSTYRTSGYFSWRYGNCPTRSYVLLVVSDGSSSRPVAYAILRGVELMGWRCGAVVDIGCRADEDSVEALEFLLTVAATRFRAAKMDMMVAACTSGRPEYRALRAAGLLRIPDLLLPQPLNFIVRESPSRLDAVSVASFGDWFLTFGDYDVL
ncbi:MAG: hypothetical protein RL213_1425 [Bacteroidota bacterium]